jgi:predicted nucleic acid-binding protein
VSLLLDTNIISELRVRRRSSEPVFAWRDANLSVPKAISVVTILELEFGTIRAEANGLPHASRLRSWLDNEVLREFEDAILPVDIEVARVSARLQTIRTFSQSDSLIAATALVHGLSVVTRDVYGFMDTGVTIINPWAP